MNTKEMSSWKRETARHFDKPEVGDYFHEMYSFWFRVASLLDSGAVVVEERKWIRDLPDGSAEYEWEPRLFKDGDVFRAAYAYGSIPGYWVAFDRNRKKEMTS